MKSLNLNLPEPQRTNTDIIRTAINNNENNINSNTTNINSNTTNIASNTTNITTNTNNIASNTTDITTNTNNISNKIDKITSPTAGRLVKVKSDGNIEEIIPDTWHYVGASGEPSFQNGWVNYGSIFEVARFTYNYATNKVEIQGLIRYGTLGTPAFTLPVGYRPHGKLPFLGLDSSTSFVSGIYRFDIDTNGDVIVYSSNSFHGINCTFGLGA